MTWLSVPGAARRLTMDLTDAGAAAAAPEIATNTAQANARVPPRIDDINAPLPPSLAENLAGLWQNGRGSKAAARAGDTLYSVHLVSGKATMASKIIGAKGPVRDIATLPAR